MSKAAANVPYTAMARSEVYTLIPSQQIEGFTVDEIQGTKASVAQSPFREGHLPQFSIVSVNAEPTNEGPFQPSLRAISKLHGRSYEFVTGKESSVFWVDEYGNVFSMLNTKGNNLTLPKLESNSVAPSGFRVYGMQDSDSMVRVLRASELLRAKHVDTEAAIKIIEPAELPLNDETIPLTEFKRRLALEYWNDGNGRRDMPKIAEALSNMTLYITVRGVQANERMADLSEAKTFAELLPILKNAFRYVNMAEAAQAAQDPTYKAEHFDLGSQDDVARYFDEYLPKRTAKNYAEMHRLRLIHYFPHSANISTVGSIYDLDSVRGEPLGLNDAPVTDDEILSDVSGAINGNGQYPRLDRIAAIVVGEGETFRTNFFKNYFAQLGWEGDVTRFNAIQQVVNAVDSPANKGITSHFTDKIAEGFNFSYSIDVEEILQKTAGILATKELPASSEDAEKFIVSLGKSFGKTVQWHADYRLRQAGYSKPLEEGSSDATFCVSYVTQEAEKFSLEAMRILDNNHDHPLYKLLDKSPKAVLHQLEQIINQHFIKQLGWEEDIITHLPDVYTLFGGFSHEADTEIVEHYVSLIAVQAGLEYRYPERSQVLIDTFMTMQQEDWQKRFEMMIGSISQKDYEKYKQDRLTQQQSSLPDQPRLGMNLLDTIERDIREQDAAVLDSLRARYGEATFDVIVRLFANREIRRMAIDQPYGNITRRLERNFYKEEFKKLGWEEDIIPHIPVIYQTFEAFSLLEDEELLEYYLNLVVQQAQINFTVDASALEWVAGSYLEDEQRALSKVLREAIKAAVPGEYMKPVLSNAYKQAGYGPADPESDVWWENWSDSMRDAMCWLYDSRCQADENRIEEQYGERVREHIGWMFIDRAEKRLEQALTTEKVVEILRQEDQMELDLLELYATNPHLADNEKDPLAFHYKISPTEKLLSATVEGQVKSYDWDVLNDLAQTNHSIYQKQFSEHFIYQVTEGCLRYYKEELGLDLSLPSAQRAAESLAKMHAKIAQAELRQANPESLDIESEVKAILQNLPIDKAVSDEQIAENSREILFMKLLQEWGWENNFVENIRDIADILGPFDNLVKGNIRDYYVSKVAEEIGWDFQIPESADELIDLFLKEEQARIQASIAWILGSDEEHDDDFDIIDEAISNIRTADGEFSEHPGDRFISFFTDLVSKRLEQKARSLRRKLRGYKDKDDIYTTLLQLFDDKESERVSRSISEDDYRRIDDVANGQIVAFKQKYSKKSA